jgi:hypothetical protein
MLISIDTDIATVIDSNFLAPTRQIQDRSLYACFAASIEPHNFLDPVSDVWDLLTSAMGYTANWSFYLEVIFSKPSLNFRLLGSAKTLSLPPRLVPGFTLIARLRRDSFLTVEALYVRHGEETLS